MGWFTLAINIAKVLAPIAKAGAYYKANKAEKAYQEYVEQQGRLLSQGHGQSAIQRDANASAIAGQTAAHEQQALADVSRGGQGAGGSGMAGQARLDVYEQGQRGQSQATGQLAKQEQASMAEAHQRYTQGLLTLSQMEYQRRQKAMGEMEKMNQQDVSDAFTSGQQVRTNMGETGQAGAAAGQAGAAEASGQDVQFKQASADISTGAAGAAS